MGASIVLNIIIGEGRIGAFSEQLKRWSGLGMNRTYSEIPREVDHNLPHSDQEE
jgi:hypothetical protein